jgi:hypothetical protein
MILCFTNRSTNVFVTPPERTLTVVDEPSEPFIFIGFWGRTTDQIVVYNTRLFGREQTVNRYSTDGEIRTVKHNAGIEEGSTMIRIVRAHRCIRPGG